VFGTRKEQSAALQGGRGDFGAASLLGTPVMNTPSLGSGNAGSTAKLSTAALETPPEEEECRPASPKYDERSFFFSGVHPWAAPARSPAKTPPRSAPRASAARLRIKEERRLRDGCGSSTQQASDAAALHGRTRPKARRADELPSTAPPQLRRLSSQITPPAGTGTSAGRTPVSQAGFRRLVPGKGQQLAMLSIEVHADCRFDCTPCSGLCEHGLHRRPAHWCIGVVPGRIGIGLVPRHCESTVECMGAPFALQHFALCGHCRGNLLPDPRYDAVRCIALAHFEDTEDVPDGSYRARALCFQCLPEGLQLAPAAASSHALHGAAGAGPPAASDEERMTTKGVASAGRERDGLSGFQVQQENLVLCGAPSSSNARRFPRHASFCLWMLAREQALSAVCLHSHYNCVRISATEAFATGGMV
jgi:hypothetical protein